MHLTINKKIRITWSSWSTLDLNRITHWVNIFLLVQTKKNYQKLSYIFTTLAFNTISMRYDLSTDKIEKKLFTPPKKND